MQPKDSLIPNEEIKFESEKHWIAPVRDSLIPAGLLVLAYLGGIIQPDADTGVAGWLGNLISLIRTGLVVVSVGWIIYNIVVWRTASFTVTNMRVLRAEGLVQRRVSESLLSGITDVKLKVGVLGKSLGYGDLDILTASGSSGEDTFRSITKAVEFRNAMLENKMAQPAAPLPGQTAPAAAAAASGTAGAPDAAATLRHLGDLRDQGLITTEEYDAKRAEVLARI
jgi:hypothetical protein